MRKKSKKKYREEALAEIERLYKNASPQVRHKMFDILVDEIKKRSDDYE